MTKQECEKKKITTYWWNFGSKQKDFNGTYKDYLKDKGIKVRSITFNGVKGYRFTMKDPYRVTLDCFNSDYIQCCDAIIKVFLTLMGDKVKFIAYRREYNINW
jgi:hypothetical protein